MWSTPSPEGYVRDDNSLIKQVAKTLKIESPDLMLDGKKMGKNWVACHIWPMSNASDPWLNSFVPNLVWLPKPFDVMSDRDGHPVQDILRHVSLLRYAAEKTVAPGVATQLFRRLNPNSGTAVGFEVGNTFKPDARWRRRYWKKVEDMAGILEARAVGDDAPCGSGHSHYDGHVGELEPENVLPLAERLRAYIAGRITGAKTTHG